MSWYEAAAFAQFREKSLPTVYHWRAAAYQDVAPQVTLKLSNFGGRGPVSVYTTGAIGPSGAYDLGGNDVKEWCWNQVGNERYILGGSFPVTDLDGPVGGLSHGIEIAAALVARSSRIPHERAHLHGGGAAATTFWTDTVEELVVVGMT